MERLFFFTSIHCTFLWIIFSDQEGEVDDI